MPKAVLLLIVAFLVIMYLVTFIRRRKNKSDSVNTVETYRKTYLGTDRTKKQIRNRTPEIDQYITKYNSSEDYREK